MPQSYPASALLCVVRPCAVPVDCRTSAAFEFMWLFSRSTFE